MCFALISFNVLHGFAEYCKWYETSHLIITDQSDSTPLSCDQPLLANRIGPHTVDHRQPSYSSVFIYQLCYTAANEPDTSDSTLSLWLQHLSQRREQIFCSTRTNEIFNDPFQLFVYLSVIDWCVSLICGVENYMKFYSEWQNYRNNYLKLLTFFFWYYA